MKTVGAKKALSWTLPLAACLTLAGCQDATDADRLAEAREEVQEELRETEEIQRLAQEALREEKQETEEARRVARKPVVRDDELEEVQEEERETEALKERAKEDIREEMKETEEALEKLARIKREVTASSTREIYIEHVEEQIEHAEERIEEHESGFEKLKGPALEEARKQYNQMNDLLSRVREELGELKSADETKWTEHRDQVQRPLDDLNDALNETQ